MSGLYPVLYYNDQKPILYRIDDDFVAEYDGPIRNFFKYYVPDMIARGVGNLPSLTSRADRICRFCGKSAPDVSFKKDAHVFPQFTGNSSLIHDIECDQCNEQFSKYETSFADHLGMFRTTDGIIGKRGIPKFRNDGLHVFAEKEPSGKYNIVIEGSNPETSIYNELDDTILFKTKKAPYVPMFVFKTLQKISYSLMLTSEIADYEVVRRVVVSNKLDDKLKGRADALFFTFDRAIESPVYFSFKKKPEYADEDLPTKIAMFYFGRFMYEYIVINSKDNFMLKGGAKARVVFCPPILPPESELPKVRKVDLSIPNKINEEESFLFKLERNQNTWDNPT